MKNQTRELSQAGCNKLSFTESRIFGSINRSSSPTLLVRPVQRTSPAARKNCHSPWRRRVTNVGWDELVGIVGEKNHGKTEWWTGGISDADKWQWPGNYGRYIWVKNGAELLCLSWDPLQSRLQSAFHQQNLGFQEEHFKNVHLLPGIHGEIAFVWDRSRNISKIKKRTINSLK